jgi:hypothetical protein
MNARLARIAAAVLAVAALAGAGLAGNYLLLGYADSRRDPVGHLTPRGNITHPGTPTLTQTSEHHRHDHPDHHGKTIEEPDD